MPGMPTDLSITMDAPPMDGQVIDHPDGSVEIMSAIHEMGPHSLTGTQHDDNLAEFMRDEDMNSIAITIADMIREDEQSRKPWAEEYERGLQYLGLKDEQVKRPWEGSCGLFHPVILEGAIRFQSNIMMEIFPASGPVRAEILGEVTRDKEEQADRLTDSFNLLLTHGMPDYRPETDKLMFGTAICGSGFRKVYPDPVRGVPAAIYVEAKDFLMPYGATSLATAQRYTHVTQPTRNEVRRLQDVGFYRPCEIQQEFPNPTQLDDKINKLNLTEPNYVNYDLLTVYECHIELDLPGAPHKGRDGKDSKIALPYVVHLVKDTLQVLAIYRNWGEKDERQQKLLWFTKYDYVPGMGGPYGMGLIQIVGQHAKACTAILRMLIDAGILANFQGGFMAQGVNDKFDDSPLTPGEWRKIALLTSAPLKDSFVPLPYKEPSAVLLQLLQMIVDDARRLASIADADIGEVSGQAPVGTTLAILERQLKNVSAIQARIYHELAGELNILMRVLRQMGWTAPGLDPKDLDGINVIPVADPNAATSSQRVMQYTAALQICQPYPTQVKVAMLLRGCLRALGIKEADDIIIESQDQPLLDPVGEMQNLMTLKPVKAFLEQEHNAHIKFLQNFLQDPSNQATIGQNPQAAQILGAFHSCIADHVGFAYRRKIEKALGTPLPAPNSPVPSDVEAYLANAIADASDQVLGQDKAQAAAQQAAQQQQDPMVQMQQAQLAIDQAKQKLAEAEFEHKKQMDVANAQSKTTLESQRIQSQHENQQASLATKTEKEQGDQLMKAHQTMADNQKTLAEVQRIIAEANKVNADTDAKATEVAKMKAEIIEILAKAKSLGESKNDGSGSPSGANQ